ncbi:MAG: HDIG domain-containing protein [Desulfovibrio sp.]|jgi:putative nucleotidyltransferase with HDIG domain|nr:HDIG domain-containing protein [Desulfovibrio sp.]
MQQTNKQPRQASFQNLFASLKAQFRCGWSIWILLATLVALAVLAGANFRKMPKFYTAGQVAETDIISDRDILVEDSLATADRRKKAMQLQPAIYDLSLEPYFQFQTRIADLFNLLDRSVHDGGDREAPLNVLLEDLPEAEAKDILPELQRDDVRSYVVSTLLPFIREQLEAGVVADVRSAQVGRSGVIFHDLDTDRELLRPDVTVLPDLQTVLAEMSTMMRKESNLSAQARRAVNILLGATLPATLTPNREATQKRSAKAVDNIEPVYYQIQKGEMLVRKGDRVTREQQLKLQIMHQTALPPMRWDIAGGSLLCGAILCLGLFIAPSGRPGTPLQRKDVLLLSCLLLLFALGAKGTYLLSLRIDSVDTMGAFGVGYPVAGAIGLIAMVFAAGRYCTMSLLLSFYCMLMFRADYTFFLNHFLGGMLITWLVVNTQSRQDVVWSVIPLTIGQLAIWAATMLLEQTAASQMTAQLVAVPVNCILSLFLLFALSPVLEMLFGYTTRFRLMELMSLEQPLMQNLMVTVPGTYHHSLVVANMVEAGARLIGANSLLCKVAALYHDVGKLSYPDYFIENQQGGPNKHDKLAPSMSALILQSHVKKGTELAERYKLGQEISDIIRQHHGTRLIRFFYQKAVKLGETPRELDFSYIGPKPQTKEAAIIMLADAVEASSRTLLEPTPARIKTHIDTIVKGIFSEGQLDESELTFKDLHFLSERFQHILTGIFHKRIAYPGQKAPEAPKGKGGESAAGAPAKGGQAENGKQGQKAAPGKGEGAPQAGAGAQSNGAKPQAECGNGESSGAKSQTEDPSSGGKGAKVPGDAQKASEAEQQLDQWLSA